ncbi:septal ring lytic transglycosylase RlpA family protein [Methylobacter sp. sgz302048]|uniref:septal ring lytic transglycosylase RlpA family protein n=1 Tax=Methylobacter sp. sgz302048 TaxID=3455945 RepID=UPI003F9EEDC1
MSWQITTSNNRKTHLQPGNIGLMLLFTSLFSGCTSVTTAPSIYKSPYPYKSPAYSHSAPYNRPYTVKGKTYYPLPSAEGYKEQGIATWYGSESGNRTAMGTRFRPHGLTAAHRILPLPTKVRVTNLRNGRYVDVIVNDRGPFKNGILIDLSKGAARKIGLRGNTEVEVEYLEDQASLNE